MNPADLFRHDTNPLQLAAGETLFQAGDTATEMFVLLEGSLEVLVGTQCVETSAEGALIGEMALIDKTVRTATVTAKSPCRLARIDQRRFHFLVQQNPFFATHVMKVLADRLRHMNERLASSESPGARA